MSRSRIVLVSPSGEILCEGESVFASAPGAEAPKTVRPAPGDAHEEPCPPTKRSPASSVDRRVGPRAA